ncbi:MAG: C40 family peptidase [Nocardiopsaceae bacterium]|nr:C40 family peptidase [Nocardiopsaceae bacterium]
MVGVTLLFAGGITAYSASGAGADPQPSISQVQATVNKLQSQVDQVGTQYDQVTQKLDSAKAKLATVKRRVGKAEREYLTARNELRQVAVASFEDSNQSSMAGLLSSSNPQDVLRSVSLLQEMANIHNAQIAKFLSAARQVAAAQAQFKRTTKGIAQIQSQLGAKKKHLDALLSKNQATLNSLNEQQQAQIASVGGGTCHASDFEGTGTPGLKAVAFAYQQLCKPYEWGGTGPDAYDCSGLTQAAWAYAGVSIPRDTYGQWAALAHVSKSELEPGDLVFFEDYGHVGIYVGDNLMIDAPATGQVVTLHSLNEAWYAENYDGAARPSA